MASSDTSSASTSSDWNDVSSVDWSFFEPGSVTIYHGAGKDWLMGRALWRRRTTSSSVPSPSSQTPTNIPPSAPIQADNSVTEDITMDTGSRSSSRRGYFGTEAQYSAPPSFPQPISASHPPVIPIPPIPTFKESPMQIGFFLARAKDPEGQARLQAQAKYTDFMYSSGLPVLPPLDSWNDRFGNFMSIRYIPPQGVQTFREMYISPFNPPQDAISQESIVTPKPMDQDERKSILTVLDRFLDHAIQLVSAVEVRLHT